MKKLHIARLVATVCLSVFAASSWGADDLVRAPGPLSGGEASLSADSLAALDDPDPQIRLEAIEGAKSPNSQFWVKALRDPDLEVRRAAIDRFLKIRDKKWPRAQPAEEVIVEQLREIVRNRNDPARHTALNALAKLLGDKAASLISEVALNDPNLSLQRGATKILAKLFPHPFGQTVSAEDLAKRWDDLDQAARRSVLTYCTEYSFDDVCKLESDIARSVLHRAAQDADPIVRRVAIQQLSGEKFDKRDSDLLIAALRDVDPVVRLIASSSTNPSPVRLKFIRSIVEGSDVQMKRYIANNSNDALVRRELLTDADPETGILALRSMMSDPRAGDPPDLVKKTFNLLNGPKYIGVQNAWEIALLFGADDPDLKPKDLLVALGSPDGTVRKEAALKFSHGDVELDPESLERLSYLGRFDRSAAVRKAAISAVNRAADRTAAAVDPQSEGPSLVVLLNDPSADRRLEAVYVIGKNGLSQYAFRVAVLLDDTDSKVRKVAAEALGQLKEPGTIGALTKAINDSEATVRISAALALGNMGDPRALSVLLEELSLRGRYSSSWKRIIHSLGKIQHPDSIRALERVLPKSDTDERQAVAEALAQLNARASAGALIASAFEHSQYGLDESETRAIVLLGALPQARAEFLRKVRDTPSTLESMATGRLFSALLTAYPAEMGALLKSNYDERKGLDDLIVGSIFQLWIFDSPGLEELVSRDDFGEMRYWVEVKKLSSKEERAKTVKLLLSALPAKNKSISGDWSNQIIFDAIRWSQGDVAHFQHRLDNLDGVRINELASIAITIRIANMEALYPYLPRILSLSPYGLGLVGADYSVAEAVGATGLISGPSIPDFLDKIPSGKVANKMLREVPGYGHGLLATVHSMLARSKSLADRLELLTTLDDRSWVASGFDPDRLAEGIRVAGIDANKPLPEVAWFVAELLKEKSRPDVALSWTERGIKEVEGRSEPALMLMLNWQKAELLWSMNRGEAALAVLEESEGKLLPVIRKQERGALARPVRAYTKTLKGGILASLGRDGLATPVLYDAERDLALDPVKTKWKERTHALIRAYRAQAQRAAAKSDAKAALAYFDQVVPKAQTVLERDAEEKALETQIKLAIGDGNYEEAQRLTERLTLKGQNKFAGGVISQSPARQQALDEIRRLRTQIQDAGRELENRAAAEGSDKKGQRQSEAAPSRPAEANPLRAMFPERSVEDLKRQRAQAQRQLKQYFVEMKRKHPEIASLVGAEPTELAQLQVYLGQGHALVQYLLLADRGWAFVATDKKLDVVEIAVTRTALEKNVRVFRTALQSGSTAGKNQGESPGQEVAGRWLTEKLITPVLPHLVGATHLVIIPNGDLHFLPFASLPVESGYLVERYSLSQLPAASALAMVTRASAETKELLAIGNATPLSDQWSPLPGAEAEVRSIANRLTGRPSSMHVRDDAKRSRLVDPSAAGKLVHLALHGEAGALDKTRLVFSDGFLKVSDIWGLALDGSPLVVLSACETALGERLPGDEVTSMANAFLFAGARAVVATLWKVPDANTQVLFDRFYDLLLAGSTPSEALTGAQRHMIAGKYPTGAWAAFVASGR